MPKKKKLPKDQPLRDLLKAGGRKGAQADFNKILKRAVEPKKNKPASTKAK
ncbi:MAG: hypothetical protein QG659_129 [Patescibacteria group bacterium]|jgi:hypothetical protein|nr:hypothetical protein [Patescibacteria group bacterium]